MRTSIISLVIFLCSIYYLSSSTISVSDFVVNSENSDYRYIGKGISRMIAVELRKNKSVTIVEREKMNAILEEQRLALSGLTDDSVITIGELLSANYIVIGEIIDMAGPLMISLRMVDVNTGEVVWSDELVENLTSYDYITAYFTSSLLASLGEAASVETEVKLDEKEEKSEETVIYLSKGIDAYDRNDKKEAEIVLRKASLTDPDNETTLFYLNKLLFSTPKFRVMTEPYFFYQNPAYLGMLREDRIYFGGASNFLTQLGDSRINHFVWQDVGDNIYLDEDEHRGFLGYSFPIIKNKLGLGIQAFYSKSSPRVSLDGIVPITNDMRDFYGGSINLGFQFNNVSTGIGGTLFYERNRWDSSAIDERISKLSLGAEAGFLFHPANKRFTLGTRFGWSNATRTTFDLQSLTENYHALVPLFWENSFGYSFKNDRTFLSILQINDFYYDNGHWLTRILPIIEHSLTRKLSFRFGVEGSLSGSATNAQAGFGVLSGFTIKIPDRGFNIDFNITFRRSPSRSDYNYLYNDLPISIMLIKDGIFIRE